MLKSEMIVKVEVFNGGSLSLLFEKFFIRQQSIEVHKCIVWAGTMFISSQLLEQLANFHVFKVILQV
jgi:hypothetical protein